MADNLDSGDIDPTTAQPLDAAADESADASILSQPPLTAGT